MAKCRLLCYSLLFAKHPYKEQICTRHWNITIAWQSTTKPRVYYMGYTLHYPLIRFCQTPRKQNCISLRHWTLNAWGITGVLFSSRKSYLIERNSRSKVSFLPLSRATVINNLSQWAIRTMNLQFKRATHHDIPTCVAGEKLNFLQRQWYAARRLLYIFILPTSTLQQSIHGSLAWIHIQWIPNK